MPKTKISEFDVDPANNTDINSINIAEGCAPSGINNAIRQLMSDLKEFQTGAGGDPVTVGGAFAANGGATLGDASGDALTINSSAVSIPNGLNFDSNTFVIDAANNRVGVGTASPEASLTIVNSVGNVLRIGSNQTLNTFKYSVIKNIAYNNNSGGVQLIGGKSDSSYSEVSIGGGVDGSYAATQLIFYTAANTTTADGSERMRIDSSGNVGIGTSSPAAKLHSSKADGGYVFGLSGTTKGLRVSTDVNQTLIQGVDNTLITSYQPLTFGGSQLIFQSNGVTEAMRIDSSGNLLVGTTASNGKVSIVSNSVSSYYPLYLNDSSTSGNNIIVDINHNGTRVGSIATTTTATSYNTSSDYRLKDITGDLTGYKERIMALQPKQGSWKSDGSVFKGFVAHEFAEQYPNAVSGEKDAVDAEGKPMYQGMQAGGAETIADLVALAKEQQAIITDLKARIETLESK